MISESQMRYASRVACHGRSRRPWRRCQRTTRAEKESLRCMGSGMVAAITRGETMHRRRFMFGGASALALPLVGACSRGGGGDDSPKPVPIPTDKVVIRMPADQYMHR